MSEGSVTYPTAEIRRLIAETWAEDIPISTKRRELMILQEQLHGMVGQIGMYLGSLEKHEQAQSIQYEAALTEARANADIRDEMIKRGMATAEELDERGYVSHETLDQAERDGTTEELLQEALGRGGGLLGGAWGLATLSGQAFEKMVRRNRRTGQFADKPGGSAPSVSVGLPNLPDAPGSTTRVRSSTNQAGTPKREVSAPRGGEKTTSYHLDTGDPAELVGQLAEWNEMTDEERDAAIHPALTPEGHEALALLKAGSSEPNPDPDSREAAKKETFEQRKIALEKAATRLSRDGVAEHTEAEMSMNKAGKTSQHSLLRFVRDALTSPSTVDMHTATDENGNRIWDEDRANLHRAIIDLYLRQRKEVPDPDNPGKTKLVLCAECDYYPDAGDERTVLFSGGGYSAGKGGIIKKLNKDGRVPANALKIDPDEIKALLPEFATTLETDPEANLRVYEEAWEVAQEVMREAQRLGTNVIVDGITNTSAEEVEERLLSFIQPSEASGGKTYVNPQIIYVDIPTEEAMRRAADRAANAEAASDRRHIPEVIMRAVHRDVAATIPTITDIAAKHGARMEVWDNDQGMFGDGRIPDEEIPEGKEEGDFRPPKRFLTVGPDHYEIEDEPLMDRLLEKSKETIPNVEVPGRGERAMRYVRDRLDLMGKRDPAKGDLAEETVGTFDDLYDKWSVELADGTVIWDASRREVHEAAINHLLTNGTGIPLEPAPEGERVALFTSGVPASGKTKILVPRLGPDNAARIDTDIARELLPEVARMIAGNDRYSGAASQREARYIADKALERAIEQGLNVIVEGTGGGDPGKFHDKIRSVQAAGYEVRVGVVDLPPEKAKERNIRRSMDELRMVSDTSIDRYSDEIPARFAEWSQDSTIHWEMYSSDVEFGADPVPLARRLPGGQIEYFSEEQYRQFLQRSRWARERAQET